MSLSSSSIIWHSQWVMTMCGWEGSRRSGIALALCCRLPPMGSRPTQGRRGEHPAYAPLAVWHPLSPCNIKRLNMPIKRLTFPEIWINLGQMTFLMSSASYNIYNICWPSCYTYTVLTSFQVQCGLVRCPADYLSTSVSLE